jgi:DNA-binding response OmpR family regulator
MAVSTDPATPRLASPRPAVPQSGHAGRIGRALDRLARASVLLVDDEPRIRIAVARILREFRVPRISEAADGETALAMLEQESFDVVICDWMMEPLDGYGFLTRLRALKNHPAQAVPVIMLTSVAEQNRVLAARDAGATEYLIKPVQPKRLLARLRVVLEMPREFIVTPAYTGPDRRRREDPAYSGPFRRWTDTQVGGARDDDLRVMLENAHRSLQQLSVGYQKRLRDVVGRFEQLVSPLRTGALAAEPGAAKDIWLAVFRVAHDLKGEAPTVGYPLAGRIAEGIATVARPIGFGQLSPAIAAERRIMAVDSHIEALRLVAERDIKGYGGPEGQHLVSRLDLAVQRIETLSRPPR